MSKSDRFFIIYFYKNKFEKKMDKVAMFLNSPVGPKTVHFWGPLANWALVLAGALDFNTKPAEGISMRMTTTLFFYSCFFMRFAWMVKPRNMMLLSCHMCNSTMQLALLNKKYQYDQKVKKATAVNEVPQLPKLSSAMLEKQM
jgi:hypothetical protein